MIVKIISPNLAAANYCHLGTQVPLTDAFRFIALGRVDVFGWFQDDSFFAVCMHAKLISMTATP